MENKTQTEDIADWIILGFHILDIYNLGSNVSWGSASYKQILVDVWKLSQAEVSNTAVIVSFFFEEQIFWFEISVHNVLRMHFFETKENSSDSQLSLMRLEFILSLN